MEDTIRYYAKEGVAYALSTAEIDEKVLQDLGYILMQSDYPGAPFIAAADGSWIIDSEQAFSMLRKMRDARIAATDYAIMPDYPLDSDTKLSVEAYRKALRDLPAQEGAPWDGGGASTPWPDIPAIFSNTVVGHE